MAGTRPAIGSIGDVESAMERGLRRGLLMDSDGAR